MAATKPRTTETGRAKPETAKDDVTDPAAAAATDKGKAAGSYRERASSLADDTRALVDDMREQLDDVMQRCSDLNDTEPTEQERPAADGIRRVPMSVSDVKRALDGLVAVCADTTLKIGAIGDEN